MCFAHTVSGVTTFNKLGDSCGDVNVYPTSYCSGTPTLVPGTFVNEACVVATKDLYASTNLYATSKSNGYFCTSGATSLLPQLGLIGMVAVVASGLVSLIFKTALMSKYAW